LAASDAGADTYEVSAEKALALVESSVMIVLNDNNNSNM
jgi:hypothetical protein